MIPSLPYGHSGILDAAVIKVGRLVKELLGLEGEDGQGNGLVLAAANKGRAMNKSGKRHVREDLIDGILKGAGDEGERLGVPVLILDVDVIGRAAAKAMLTLG